MSKRHSWNEIKANFAGLWVELVDCDWDWNDANPRYASVRNFSVDRKKLISKNNKDSVILYVNSLQTKEGMPVAGYYKEAFDQAAGY